MRLKTYWHIFKQLISNPRYYVEVTTAPFGLIFRFFLMSIILLSFSSTLRTNLKLLPEFEQKLVQSLEGLPQKFPENLEITWNQDRLELFPDEDLEVPYPEGIPAITNLPPLLGHITSQELNPDKLNTYFDQQSLLIVTTQKFYVNNLQGNWDSLKLSDLLPNKKITLNKNTLPEAITKFINGSTKMLNIIKKLNYLVMPVILFIAKFWMAFSEGLLVFLFMKLNRIKINFKQTLQLSLAISIVAEFINQITTWFYPNLSFSMASLSYWIIFSFIFWIQLKQFSQLNHQQD